MVSGLILYALARQCWSFFLHFALSDYLNHSFHVVIIAQKLVLSGNPRRFHFFSNFCDERFRRFF